MSHIVPDTFIIACFSVWYSAWFLELFRKFVEILCRTEFSTFLTLKLLLAVKFRWFLNIYSVQLEELAKMWFGTESSCAPYVALSESQWESSFDARSSFHHGLDLELNHQVSLQKMTCLIDFFQKSSENCQIYYLFGWGSKHDNK